MRMCGRWMVPPYVNCYLFYDNLDSCLKFLRSDAVFAHCRVQLTQLISKLYRPDPSCRRRKAACGASSARRWTRFPAGSPPPVSCTPRGSPAARAQGLERTDPRWHRPGRIWCASAWSVWKRRIGWEAPWPSKPVRGSPPDDVAGFEPSPSIGSGAHPCCRQPTIKRPKWLQLHAQPNI